ncbi:unnamed protein product [Rotaria sp. Silwood2]|nr:unnamed protein product [Rotaria sp. Silwood2]CAF4466613.1 unnamed protein product [Rotaria sp. Silwood2]
MFPTFVIEARAVLTSDTHRSDVKHFESKLDTIKGYWSPSTSSIDWCERNYILTKFHGTLPDFGQTEDELAMVYTMIIWWSILVRMVKFNKVKDKTYAVDLAIVFGIFYAVL